MEMELWKDQFPHSKIPSSSKPTLRNPFPSSFLRRKRPTPIKQKWGIFSTFNFFTKKKPTYCTFYTFSKQIAPLFVMERCGPPFDLLHWLRFGKLPYLSWKNHCIALMHSMLDQSAFQIHDWTCNICFDISHKSSIACCH